MSRFRFRPNLEQIESRLVPAPVTAMVSGSLILNNSAVNVSGVPVTLTGTSAGGITVNSTAVSNSTGAYTFQNVLPGTYTLAAGSAPGVVGTTTPLSVTVPTGTDIVQDLSYSGGLAPSFLSLRSFLNEPNIAALTFPTGGTGTAVAAERPDSAPTVTTQQADVNRTVSSNAETQNINLAGLFTDTDITNSEVSFNITNGGINTAMKMTLFDTTAPQTVANFLDYVESGAFANALFTRNDDNFVLQGGGAKISLDGQTISPTTVLPPVPSEFTGVSNLKYTVAMALSGGNPNSGTNQFFINTGDNAFLDAQNFTVFGVIEEADSQGVLQVLNATPTLNLSGTATAAANPSVLLDNLPLSNYSGNASTFPTGATRNNYMVINGITITRNTERLSYTVTSSNTSLVTATVQGSHLTLNYVPGQTGTSTITITAKDKFGITTSQTFDVTVTATASTNSAPTVAQQIDGQTNLVDAAATTIGLADKFDDVDIPNGDSLTFTADSSAPNIVAVNVSGNQLSVTPQSGQTGLSTITVTATDSEGESVFQTFQVSLQSNAPTVANQLPDLNADVDSSPSNISLLGAFNDLDLTIGDVLTYTAQSNNTNLVNATVSGSDLILTYVPAQQGIATITVKATDANNLFVSQTFHVIVTPAAATGQTAIHTSSEYFTADRNSGSSGELSSVSGDVIGGLENAPTFYDGNGNVVTASAAVRKQTEAEILNGTDSFSGTIEVPVAQQTLGMTSLLIHPGDSHNFVNANVLRLHDANGNRLVSIQLNKVNGNIVIRGHNQWGTTFPGSDITLTDSEWVNVWIAWEFSGNHGKWAAYAQVGEFGTPTLLVSHDETGFSPQVAGRIELPYSGSAFQAPFEGRVAMARLYEADTYANAQQAPTDFLWPQNSPVTHTVASWTEFVQKWNDNVILGRLRNFERNGVLVDLSTVADANALETWWNDFQANPAEATGDVVQFPAGDISVGSTPMIGVPLGVNFQWNAAGTRLVLSDAMTGTWSQPDATNLPNVWKYDGDNVFGRNVWQIDGANRLWYIPTFASNLAQGLTQVQDKEWSIFTDATGATYIHAANGDNPNLHAFQGSKPIPNVNLTGSYSSGPLTVIGGTLYDFSKTDPYQRMVENSPTADYNFKTITVIRDATFLEASKHAFTAAGNFSNGAIFRWNNTYGLNPPALGGSNNEYGVPPGAYSLEVDFTAENTSALAPGRAGFAHTNPTVVDAIAIEGTAGGRPLAGAEFAYYIHGAGAQSDVFALGIFEGIPANWFPSDWTGTVPAQLAAVVTNVVIV